jgi:hypothetical protein
MSPADIRNLTQTRPFRPFRIVTSDGTIYEVRHPELVMFGMGSLVIGYAHPTTPWMYERFDIVSLRHIVRLEPIEPQQTEAVPG